MRARDGRALVGIRHIVVGLLIGVCLCVCSGKQEFAVEGVIQVQGSPSLRVHWMNCLQITASLSRERVIEL